MLCMFRYLLRTFRPRATGLKAWPPPGAQIEILLDSDSPSEPRSLGIFTVGVNGRYQVLVDGLSSSETGRVVHTTTNGHVFSAHFAVLHAIATIDGPYIAGRASAGTAVTVEVHAPDRPLSETGTYEVAADQRWRARLDPETSVNAGVALTVTKVGGPLAEPQVLAGRVPTLTVEADVGSGRIHGFGPARSKLTVEARPPRGARVEEVVTTDARGAFALELGDGSTISSGWRIAVLFDADEGLRFRAERPMVPLRIALYGNSVTGVIDKPGAMVAITLTNAAGIVESTGFATSRDDGIPGIPNGQFSFSTDQARIDPGDVLELDWRQGDPLVLRVPKLTARADVEADTVSGDAPPGSQLRVAVSAGGMRDLVARTVVADAVGRYTAVFGGSFDIERGVAPHHNGPVVLVTG